MINSPGPGDTGLLAEWPSGLDVAALLESGWRPVPFRYFVLKVFSRCDLSCTYCYVYRGQDQSWRSEPRLMSHPLVDAACDRIIEHATVHRLTRVSVMLHGSEPLLAPIELVEHLARRLRDGLPRQTNVDLRIQTNGITLTAEKLDRLLATGFRIGISLDGDAADHDRNRVHADGSGSHAHVEAALRLLSRRPGALTGLLCTIDLRNDPVAVFNQLVRHDPPVIDFLLPHGNWDHLPPGRAEDGRTPYGDWLVAAFDRWCDDRRTTVRVRLFEEIIRLWCRRPSRSEQIGLSPSGVVVVATSGRIELVDTLRSAYEGAAATGYNVLHDSFDACLLVPGMVARQIGEAALSVICRDCGIHQICGGGYYPHRYRAGHGFLNPSVYCADLQRLIRHIGARVSATVAP